MFVIPHLLMVIEHVRARQWAESAIIRQNALGVTSGLVAVVTSVLVTIIPKQLALLLMAALAIGTALFTLRNER